MGTESAEGYIDDLIHSMPMGGHMGRDRMEKIVGTRFYWKGCAKEVRESRNV